VLLCVDRIGGFMSIWLASSSHLPTPARGQHADDRRKIYEMFKSRFAFRLPKEIESSSPHLPNRLRFCSN
jgi:hypothetical protein